MPSGDATVTVAAPRAIETVALLNAVDPLRLLRPGPGADLPDVFRWSRPGGIPCAALPTFVRAGDDGKQHQPQAKNRPAPLPVTSTATVTPRGLVEPARRSPRRRAGAAADPACTRTACQAANPASSNNTHGDHRQQRRCADRAPAAVPSQRAAAARLTLRAIGRCGSAGHNTLLTGSGGAAAARWTRDVDVGHGDVAELPHPLADVATATAG